jgi:8-oxo-dGTP pyrophosphatase MutT (NUDIX family)
MFLNPARIARALQASAQPSSDYDLNPEARPRRGRALRPASVLVPLVERGPELNMILTRRASALRHHPGQIAFPGGKQNAADATPLDAALREAREEIGLDPARVEVLGSFEGHETVTDFAVTPFVGLIGADFMPVLDRREVDEVFEIPLAFLLDSANLQRHGRVWGGRWRQYYAIPYGPHYVWGATARMIKSLSDRLELF